jgi:hypothetical protein
VKEIQNSAFNSSTLNHGFVIPAGIEFKDIYPDDGIDISAFYKSS